MSNENKKNKNVKLFLLSFFIFATPIFAVIYYKGGFYNPGPYRHPQIRSDPYVSRGNCVIKNYNRGDNISLDCVNRDYYFSYDDAEKYGLKINSKQRFVNGKWIGYYYRVGDDLILICSDIYSDSKVCEIEKNAFIR